MKLDQIDIYGTKWEFSTQFETVDAVQGLEDEHYWLNLGLLLRIKALGNYWLRKAR